MKKINKLFALVVFIFAVVSSVSTVDAWIFSRKRQLCVVCEKKEVKQLENEIAALDSDIKQILDKMVSDHACNNRKRCCYGLSVLRKELVLKHREKSIKVCFLQQLKGRK